ncbi:hypothetical protein KIN20_021252 [Parelaphostrongylus tenuis]|uniref:Uncharacterized protein n=1 Tax=Parelaphostrongylus tenuis TaxID=148309 RepID=A0AAD5QU24_PARTN|nr:hypothetical protein KIN20_021252 [Parelaphostrongylus tenuis]
MQQCVLVRKLLMKCVTRISNIIMMPRSRLAKGEESDMSRKLGPARNMYKLESLDGLVGEAKKANLSEDKQVPRDSL